LNSSSTKAPDSTTATASTSMILTAHS